MQGQKKKPCQHGAFVSVFKILGNFMPRCCRLPRVDVILNLPSVRLNKTLYPDISSTLPYKVMRYKDDTKTHMLLYAGEGENASDELEEDLVGVQGKIQGIDKWQIWEESDR